MKIIKPSRNIRSPVIQPLSNEESTSGSGNTHTHDNKAFLDALNIDHDKRLIYNQNILAVPLSEEGW